MAYWKINRILFYSFFVLLALTKTVKNRKDPDFFWYIEDGATFVEKHQIPTTNPYIFLPSTEWVAHSILFYGALYYFYKLLGDRHLYVFTSFVLIVLYIVIILLLSGKTEKLLSFILLFSGVYYLIFWGTTLRPHLFTYIFLGITYILYEKNKLFYMIFLLPLWSFLHAGVISGIGVLAIFGAYELYKGHVKRTIRVFIYLVVGLGGILIINPYHLGYFKQIIHAFKEIHLLSKFITEWSPLLPYIIKDHVPYYILAFIVMILFIYSFFTSRKRKEIVDIFLVLFFTYSAISHVRNLPVLGITLAWVMPKYIDYTSLGSFSKLTFKDLEHLFMLPVLITLHIVLITVFIKMDKTFYTPSSFYPVNAVKFLKTCDSCRGNILLPSDLGGFVEYYLYPRFKVSLDGRLSVPDSTFLEFNLFWRMKIDPIKYIQKYRVNYILIPLRFQFFARKLTAHSEIHPFYKDSFFTILCTSFSSCKK